MDDAKLVCNYKKCQIQIEGKAFVTACSHVFCVEHGISTRNLRKCPACKTLLNRPTDHFEVDLNPSEEFKSNVLKGLPPPVVFDVANRALSFWMYQMRQQQLSTVARVKHMKNKSNEMFDFCEGLLEKQTKEEEKYKKKLSDLKKDLDDQKQNTEKLAEQLAEKTRKLRQAQAQIVDMHRCNLEENVTQSPRKRSKVAVQRTGRNSQNPSFQPLFGNKKKANCCPVKPIKLFESSLNLSESFGLSPQGNKNNNDVSLNWS